MWLSQDLWGTAVMGLRRPGTKSPNGLRYGPA